MPQYSLKAWPALSPDGTPTFSVIAEDGAIIPCVRSNRDCRRFLEEWEAGAEVLDAEGAPLPYSDEACAALGLAAPAVEDGE